MLSEETSFALLRLEQTRILVPQREIRVLDLTMDVERGDRPPGGIGWISFKRQFRPVYCPSAELEWLTEAPADRPICAVVEAKGNAFGLLCTEVTLLQAQEVVFHEIPAAMATPHSPFDGLAIVTGSLACVSSAEQLFNHLETIQADDEHALQEAL